MEEQMQRQRFERKYFLNERQAIGVREFVRCYLIPDEFSSKQADYSYPVHSIYLDSPSLATYWATVHCEKKRFKLRVRYYDDLPDSPIFFEIKRRENECILKQRGMVRRDAGAFLLAGQMPGPEHMLSPKTNHLAAVQRFVFLMERLHARPTVHVGYSREAWMSPETNSVRVTIDRQVRGEPRTQAIFSTLMTHPVYAFGNQAVLELKFTDRFPHWFGELVRHFNLTQTGAPKYCGSIMEAGEERIMRTAPTEAQQKLAQVLEFC
jgi:hypothetical protein